MSEGENVFPMDKKKKKKLIFGANQNEFVSFNQL